MFPKGSDESLGKELDKHNTALNNGLGKKNITKKITQTNPQSLLKFKSDDWVEENSTVKTCKQDSNFCHDNTSDHLIYIRKTIQFPHPNPGLLCFSFLFFLIFT